MTEMLTITQDFRTPALDAMKQRSRESGKRNGHKESRAKQPFQPKAIWKRCAGGMEER